jgi:hypothetical protein
MQEVRLEKFIKFVTTLSLEGLGSDVKTLERLCHDDEEALLMLSDATIGKLGCDRKSEKARDGNIKTDIISLDIGSYGTSRSSALCRLRKDRAIPGIICALLFLAVYRRTEARPRTSQGAAGDWASGGGLQLLRERRMAQLLERFAFDLPDTLASDPEEVADLFERMRLAAPVEAETHPDDLLLARGERA